MIIDDLCGSHKSTLTHFSSLLLFTLKVFKSFTKRWSYLSRTLTCMKGHLKNESSNVDTTHLFLSSISVSPMIRCPKTPSTYGLIPVFYFHN